MVEFEPVMVVTTSVSPMSVESELSFVNQVLLAVDEGIVGMIEQAFAGRTEVIAAGQGMCSQ